MSIIYDALQKVERKPSCPTPAKEIKSRPQKKLNKAPVPLLLVAFAIIAVILYPQMKKFLRKSAASDASFNTSSTATQLPKPLKRTLNLSLPKLSLAQPQQKNKEYSYNTQLAGGSEFTLSGIVYAKSKYMAIINGRGVTKGDTIENAVVSDISEKSVILTLNDKKISLYLY